MTQTYLGEVEPGASAFVYYLFEDYNPDQVDFTEAVQRRLEDLGELFEDRVSLLMPNPRYAVRIESEVRKKVEDLWWSMQGKLPGLLFTTRPLSEFDGSTGEYVLVPFESTDADSAAKTISKVRRLADDHLSWQHKEGRKQKKGGLAKRIFDALELKPGAGGIKLDLKKLGRR